MKKELFIIPVLLSLLMLPLGCVRPCRNALNHHAVISHEFGDIDQVILGADGSVAFVGNHIFYRWVPDYTQKKMVKHIDAKRAGYVVGSAENMKTLAKQAVLAEKVRQAANDPKLVKMQDKMSQPLKEPKLVKMQELQFSKGRNHFDKSCYGIDLQYEPWHSFLGDHSQPPQNTTLLPKNLRNGVVYSVQGKPLTYSLDGETVDLDFTGITAEVERNHVKWWGPVAYPFAKVTDTGLSTVLFGWTVALLPVDLVFDKILHIPAFQFLWPAPFYNTWRKSKGVRPLNPNDFAPE